MSLWEIAFLVLIVIGFFRGNLGKMKKVTPVN